MKSLFYTFLLLLSAGLAYSQQQHVFVIVSNDNINLKSIDLSNCTSRFIDTLPIGMGSIACTPDGRLWAVVNDTVGADLYLVDTTTGHITFTGHFETHDYIATLVALNDSILLTQSDSSLYAITTTNVHTYLVGHVGYYRFGDLAWYGDDLYLTYIPGTDEDSMLLVKVTFNSDYTAITSSIQVSNTPTVPYCYGLTTAIIPGIGLALIGLSEKNAYKINPIDGSYEILCSPIISDSISYLSDGASMIFPSPPTTPNNPIAKKDEVKIYPNPSNNQLFINCNDSNAVLTLTDITGRTILQQPLTKTIQQVNIAHIAAGIYIVTVRTVDKVIYRQKIVKV